MISIRSLSDIVTVRRCDGATVRRCDSATVRQCDSATVRQLCTMFNLRLLTFDLFLFNLHHYKCKEFQGMALKHKNRLRNSKEPGRFSRFVSDFTITKKTRKYFLFAMPAGAVLITLFILTVDKIDELSLIFIIPGTIFLFLPITLFLYIPEKRMLGSVLIPLFIILLALLFKKQHWPGGSLILTLGLLVMGLGYLILSVRYYHTIKNNKYLRIVSTLACIFIAMTCTGVLFRYQHWPGGWMATYGSLFPSLILTLIVLITLPGSGYINWERKHKRIFTQRLLVPWIFFLLFVATVYLLPKDISDQIFKENRKEGSAFNMEYYDLEIKEGMEPDQ
ncbi:hypothetical protein ACFLT1_00405 [Bacteroidota bacterium]